MVRRFSSIGFAVFMFGTVASAAPPAPVPPSECVPGVPATPPLTRLTNVEYRNTVSDLLMLEELPELALAPDSPGPIDEVAEEAYRAAAAAIAEAFVGDETARSMVLPCQDDDAECVNSIVVTLGGRAYRRPLTQEEIAEYEELFTGREEPTETGSFDEALGRMVESFLSAPPFLNRTEISEEQNPDGNFVLNDYEIASRLSYMLWQTMPDETLFLAADAGLLATNDQIQEQAFRMAQDDRARPMVAAFHQRYLRMGPNTRWDHIDLDTNVYPAFTPELVPLMAEETALFMDHVVFEWVGRFQDLLSSNAGFVNQELAPFYGFDSEDYGPDFVEVQLAADRPGVFTRLWFLAAHSYSDRTSPISRGAFLLRNVLCMDLAPPPGAADALFPSNPELTNREKVELQTSDAPCVGCHQIINPMGFPLEAFDALGQSQTTDAGKPIDTTGTVYLDSGANAVDVNGPLELMQQIADAPAAHHCYAKSWVEFAYRRNLAIGDDCLVSVLAARISTGNYAVLDLLQDLTDSESFRLRAPEVREGGTGTNPNPGTGLGGAGSTLGQGGAAAGPGSAGSVASSGSLAGSGDGGDGADGSGDGDGGDGRDGAGASSGSEDGGSSSEAEGLRGLSTRDTGCACRVAEKTERRSAPFVAFGALVLVLGFRRTVRRTRTAPQPRPSA